MAGKREAQPRFVDFEDFYRHYVGDHSRGATRWIHFVGLQLGLAMLLGSVAVRSLPLGALGGIVTLLPAWASHLALEHNLPSLLSAPAWSIRASLSMVLQMWQGRDTQLARMATANLAARRRTAVD